MAKEALSPFRSVVFFVIKVEDTAFIGFKHFFSFSLCICLIRVELLLKQTVILFQFVGKDYFLFRRVVNTFISLLHAELNGRLSHVAVRKRIVFFKLFLPIAAIHAQVRFPQRAWTVAQLVSLCSAHCRLSLVPVVLVIGLLEDGDGVFFPVGLHVARVERHVVVLICFFVALSLVRNQECFALHEFWLVSGRSLGRVASLRRRVVLTRLPLHFAHVPLQALKVDLTFDFDFYLENVLMLSVGQSRLLKVGEHEKVWHH